MSGYVPYRPTDTAVALAGSASWSQFGDSLQGILRDRLVRGCCGKHRQYKLLLAELSLTYDKAVQLARSDETADRGTKDLSGSNGGPTHKLHGSKQKLHGSNPRPQDHHPKTTTPKPPTT